MWVASSLDPCAFKRVVDERRGAQKDAMPGRVEHQLDGDLSRSWDESRDPARPLRMRARGPSLSVPRARSLAIGFTYLITKHDSGEGGTPGTSTWCGVNARIGRLRTAIERRSIHVELRTYS